FQEGLSDDDGRLLISMRGGLGQIRDGNIEPYIVPSGIRFTPKQLLRDRDGGRWIGTPSEGLFHLHQGKMDRFTRAGGLSGDMIVTLFQDREGNIWVATTDGLDRFRDFAVPTISVEQGLSGSRAGSVLASADGSVWLAAQDGLNRWNNGRITVYP